ncbi:MAG TPA: hypothetical protein VNW29_05515 [Candidatus Sulfotelmatobacter sp.]|jgi:hypothetical protein|nr:hypothetical protein [Candidatus Sulfotelmatobacter sp.]
MSESQETSAGGIEKEPTTGERIWGPVLDAARRGETLSPDDQKALRIRDACFDIADYWNAVGENAVQDLSHEAELYMRYAQGYQTLDQEGVVTGMHNDGGQRLASDPPLLDAEFVGGQWQGMRAREGHAIPYDQILPQLQEMATSQHAVGDEPAFGIDVANLRPKMQSWMIGRMYVNSTKETLASNLGRTPHPDTPQQNPPQS